VVFIILEKACRWSWGRSCLRFKKETCIY